MLNIRYLAFPCTSPYSCQPPSSQPLSKSRRLNFTTQFKPQTCYPRSPATLRCALLNNLFGTSDLLSCCRCCCFGRMRYIYHVGFRGRRRAAAPTLTCWIRRLMLYSQESDTVAHFVDGRDATSQISQVAIRFAAALEVPNRSAHQVSHHAYGKVLFGAACGVAAVSIVHGSVDRSCETDCYRAYFYIPIVWNTLTTKLAVHTKRIRQTGSQVLASSCQSRASATTAGGGKVQAITRAGTMIQTDGWEDAGMRRVG